MELNNMKVKTLKEMAMETEENSVKRYQVILTDEARKRVTISSDEDIRGDFVIGADVEIKVTSPQTKLD